MKANKGFAALEGVMLVGVMLLIAGVGYVGWKAFAKSDATSQQTTISASKSAEVITTKADLEAAEKALGELNFDDDDSAEAEAQAKL